MMVDSYRLFKANQEQLRKHEAKADILKLRSNSDIDYLEDLIKLTRELKLRNNLLTEKLSALTQE